MIIQLIKYYQLIALDLKKQQKLDADSKAIEAMFFIIEEAEETKLKFSNGTVKEL